MRSMLLLVCLYSFSDLLGWCTVLFHLSPNLSFCFSLVCTSVLYPRCSPRPHSHTLTEESKSSSNLFSPFSSFYHYIPLSSIHADYFWWYCSQRKWHFWWKLHTHTHTHMHTHFRSLQHSGSTWGSDVFKEQSLDHGKVRESVSVTSIRDKKTHNSVPYSSFYRTNSC